MKLFLRLLILAIVLQASPALAADITVSAAASLTNAFSELKEVFIKAHPDSKVFLNFAASNPLLKQMQAGAPVDIFASADQATMNKAEASDLMFTESRKNFVKNTLVLIVPKNAPTPAAVAELSNEKFARIAIGNPASVPAGRYAKEALTNANLWESLQNKYIMAESVRQVLDYVARAETDAGIVYATDAYKGKDKVVIALTLQSHTPIEYPIALTKAGAQNEDAKAFIALVLSKEGQEILAKYGFSSAAN